MWKKMFECFLNQSLVTLIYLVKISEDKNGRILQYFQFPDILQLSGSSLFDVGVDVDPADNNIILGVIR